MAEKKKASGCGGCLLAVIVLVVVFAVVGALLPKKPGQSVDSSAAPSKPEAKPSSDAPTAPPAVGGGDKTDSALNGTWVLRASTANGKPFNSTQFNRCRFIMGRVIMNGTRELRYEVDPGSSPKVMRIYNVLGDNSRITVYTCIYRVGGDLLDLTFNAGDTVPTSFESGPNDTTIAMQFAKAGP